MSLADQADSRAQSRDDLIAARRDSNMSVRQAAQRLLTIIEDRNLAITARDLDSIRRTINRHESGGIATISQEWITAYCHAYDRQPHQLLPVRTPSLPTLTELGATTFTTTGHKFIPAYVGVHIDALTSALTTRPARIAGVDCRAAEIHLDPGYGVTHGMSGTLYLFPFGVALLHEQQRRDWGSIAELAIWRRATHRTTRQLLAGYLTELLGAPIESNYVLSAWWLHKPGWTGRDLDTAMRLLCQPRAVLGNADIGEADDLDYARSIEAGLFTNGFAPPEHVPCGVDGVSIGWASWSGVVYYPIQPRAALNELDLVHLEIGAQALWMLCHEIRRQVIAGEDPTLIAGYDLRWLRGRRLAIASAGETEPQQTRLLRNAVLETSELTRKLTETIDLIKECQ